MESSCQGSLIGCWEAPLASDVNPKFPKFMLMLAGWCVMILVSIESQILDIAG
jgi:hypothetical protein